MNRAQRSFAAIGGAALCCLLIPAMAAAGELDQQQTSENGLVAIYSSQSLAQTFTAGKSGGLDQVDLDLQKGGTPSALTVEIRDVAAGSPGSQVLAAASLPGTNVTSSIGFVPIHFPTPATVTAGTHYAIVGYSTSTGGDFFQWGEKGPDTYPGGTGATSFATPPTTWSATSWDFAFKTYVAPPASTAPGPTGQRAAALAKCKKKKTYRARKRCRRRARKLPL